ncbi:MAG: hydrogenase [Elusimicrobia bacterium]|nr:hydrogenase [Elusimicrobiota bacterium]
MSSWIELAVLFLILSNFALLGASRVTTLIQVAAGQGILLGLLPLLAHAKQGNLRLIAVALIAGLLKGVIFPVMLGRALREANIRREVEPFVGYSLSLILGVFALACSFWIASRLPATALFLSRKALPAAFSTILTGFFMIVARRKALTQVLGYLVLENGIYLFSISLGQKIPFAVELGVLLDVFVAVFVMGIAMFHINREFDHLDVGQLSALKD